MVIVRNIFLGLKIATRVRKLARILESIVFHPAQTILLSFFLVILVGALALMTPFATADGAGLPFLKAWFTSTSAVCVTGLIVADTATAFTLFGKITIMVLIQTGGLGIMIISYFTLFSLKKAFSLEDKLLISYMLSENDMRQLGTAVRRIILSTFIIESIGAVILTLRFAADFGMGGQALLFGIFHAVSAFCNAGFALFTDSLEGFAGDPAVSLTAAGLIIAGGISFAVIANVKALAERTSRKLSWNSRLVLAVTGILIFSGFLVIYGLEHDNTLRNLPTGTQYLAAFFQSVTVRTAGFNTLPIGSLVPATLLFMIVLMFIGGASGSTAGGIELDQGEILANKLISPDVLDKVPISKTISMTEIYAPEKVVGKTPAELDLRKKDHINIVAIKRNSLSIDGTGNALQGEDIVFPGPNESIQESDILIVLGKNEDIEAFREE